MMSTLYTPLLCLLMALQVYSQSATPVIGVEGGSTELVCDIAPDNPSYLRWSDYIHNEDRDPALIYDSTDNPSRALNIEHPRKDDFLVTEDLRLRIVSLVIEDYGTYQCETEVNGEKVIKKFEVSVVGKPQCRGPRRSRSGEKVSMTCQMEYWSNDIPTMEWYDPADTMVQSRDMTEIGMFKKSIQVTAGPELDGQKFVCKAMLAGIDQQCTVTLNVSYPVQDITIRPMKKTYSAGEKIVCSAKGNPAPAVAWAEAGKALEILHQGKHTATLQVAEEWMGSSKTFTCSASNSINEEHPTILTTNTTITVDDTKVVPEPEDPDTAKPEPSTAGGVSTAGVVGGIIAAVIIIIVIIAIVYTIRKRTSKKPKGAKQVPTRDHDDLRRDMEAKA